ncbi:MAG TPA: hypothetical protein VGC41_10435 [Kofleriaceae bacterium]
MSTSSEVLLWAGRIIAKKKTAKPHELLEIKLGSGVDVAQDAFHKIARFAHPDLHRTGLNEDEFELVTTAYAAIANAYQTYRTQTMATARTKPMTSPPPGGAVPATPSGAPGAITGVAGAMSSRALVYYRKAELCLKRGDLTGATLQLKMAIGTDPASTFLRTALHEVEGEIRKTT